MENSRTHFLITVLILSSVLLLTCGGCKKEKLQPVPIPYDNFAIVSSNPGSGTVNIPLDTNVSIEFNQEIDESTIDSSTVFISDAGGPLSASLSYDDITCTATLNPDNLLEYSTEYYVTVTTGVIGKDMLGNRLTSDYVFTFRTIDPPNLLIVAMLPGSNSTNISTDMQVQVVFDQDIDPASITSNSFYIKPENGSVLPVSFLLPPSTAPNKAVLIPDAPLDYDTIYEVTLTTDIRSAIATASGGNLAANTVYTFETQPVPPLEITDIFPEDGAVGVSLSVNPQIIFNADVFESTLGDLGGGPNFFINPGLVSDNSTAVSATINYSSVSHTATLIPSSPLPFSSDYTLTVKGGGTGVIGTAGQILPATYTSQFRTRISGLILTTDPSNLETDVDVDRQITVKFTEIMNTSTIDITSFYITYIDRFERTITVPGTFSFTDGDRTAVFTPNEPLPHNTDFTVTLTSAITTADGFQNLTGGYIFTFTTSTPPMISTTRAVNDYVTIEPLPNENDVPVTSKFEIVFAREMDGSTIDNTTFLLFEDASSTPVNGSAFLATDFITAIFEPDNNLAFDTTYRITLQSGNSGVKDSEGNFLETDFSFIFRTSEANIVDAVPKQINVRRERAIVACFSRPVAPGKIIDKNFYVIDELTGLKLGGLIAVAPDRKSISLSPIPEMENQDHTIHLTIGILDYRGNPLASEHTQVFSVNFNSDQDDPMIESFTPVNSSIVSGGTEISVVLTEYIIPQSFLTSIPPDNTSDTVFLSYMNGADIVYVPGIVSISFEPITPFRTTATFTPEVYLDAGTTYTFRATTKICDLASLALTADCEWFFGIETQAPTIAGTNPVNTTTDINVTTDIAVIFSEPMKLASVNPSNFTVTTSSIPIPGTYSVTDNSIIFTPDTYLTGGLLYDVTVNGSVTDLAGNEYGLTNSFSFTTENTPPTVTDLSPENDSDISSDIIITFSEPVSPGSVWYSTVSIPGSVKVTDQSAQEVYGDIYISGDKVIFDPAEDLTAGITYTVTVTTNVTDLGGTQLDQDGGTGGNQEFTGTFSITP